ncbi:MAG: CvpA family protein [Saprospiraceae bacterium]|nr:CvpA family protein [Saprospiraceae bacterium]
MNYLDIILIIPIIWFTYKSFSKGFIIEIATLVALILGIYAAIHFSYFASDLITDNLEIGEKYLSLTSFTLTFLIVIAIVILIGKGLEKIINLVLLGVFNKVAGAVFGLVKTVFILSVILFFINKVDEQEILLTKETKEKSILYKTVASVAPAVFPKLKIAKIKEFMPDEKEEIEF